MAEQKILTTVSSAFEVGHGWQCILCNAPVFQVGHQCPAEARIREIIREELIKSNLLVDRSNDI